MPPPLRARRGAELLEILDLPAMDRPYQVVQVDVTVRLAGQKILRHERSRAELVTEAAQHDQDIVHVGNAVMLICGFFLLKGRNFWRPF